jgi:Carbon-nitrogen hydrolase
LAANPIQADPLLSAHRAPHACGKHRKLVPTNQERMVHGFGDGSTLKVFDTPVGKVGGLICWENWMPLARYALYSQGEQIHVAPTAFDDEMAIVNAGNTAFEGDVFVISVCMILRKSSFPIEFEFQDELTGASEFPESGGSCIIAPGGRVLAGPVWKEEGILYADLDLNETVGAGQLLDNVGHYARSANQHRRAKARHERRTLDCVGRRLPPQFNGLPTAVNLALTLVPVVVSAPIITTPIRPAINPYSMAVAAELHLRKR